MTIESRKRPHENLRHFLAGGISGACAETIVAPIERAKLLLQLQSVNSQLLKQSHYKGFFDVIKRIPKEQGFTSLWRGNGVNVVRYFFTQALNFSFKEKYQKLFHSEGETFYKFFFSNLAAGGLAGATSLCFVFPLDLARTKLALDIGKKESREYKGLADVIGAIYRKNGFRGLYNGFQISVVGIFFYRSVYFGGFDTAKTYLPPNPSLFLQWGAAQSVAMCSGLVAYPFDSVRRRMMMQSGKDKKLYTSGLQCFKTVIKEEGFRALYKGSIINMFRGTGGAIVLVCYEYLDRYLTFV
ncbi:adenine nucleotide translocase-1 [Rozella allomycis CSF55]|uniref:ADP/ATP translocase n=1 Tax=Rozella allomycis (strain CSF55) TaxID=988480 RepID=A0A4P9YHE4_ROZAC|nr:adenine nucleotide translocase-1 [Rozella allomycis CSF55]